MHISSVVHDDEVGIVHPHTDFRTVFFLYTGVFIRMAVILCTFTNQTYCIWIPVSDCDNLSLFLMDVHGSTGDSSRDDALRLGCYEFN